MKPLFVLLGAFVIIALATRYFHGAVDYSLAGRIGMSAMLLFAAIGHFVYTKGMTLMIPDFIPLKRPFVYFTGLIEIIGAVGLLIPQLEIMTAWWLIVFFILILPANINAAIRHVDFQKGTYNGYSLKYLWFRVPLQIFFIVWIYWFAVRMPIH